MRIKNVVMQLSAGACGAGLLAFSMPALASGDVRVVFYLLGAALLQGALFGVGALRARRWKRVGFVAVYVASAAAAWKIALETRGDDWLLTFVLVSTSPWVVATFGIALLEKLNQLFGSTTQHENP